MGKGPEIADLLETLRQLMPQLSSRYRVETLGVFGSYVRQEQRPDSDLVKVDLVMAEALKPAIGRRILQEVVPI